MVIRHNYTRSPKRAQAGLRYYQMRPRGKEEPPRSIFDSDGSITRTEAYRLMRECQAAPEPDAAPDAQPPFLCHRIVLAPSDEERPEDLREMTRDVMRELEKDKGLRLHWVAIEHRHTEHHHVHVLLFGAGEDVQGQKHEVRLHREDHTRMKAEAGEYCAWERDERREWERALESAYELERDEQIVVEQQRLARERDPEPIQLGPDDAGAPSPQHEPRGLER